MGTITRLQALAARDVQLAFLALQSADDIVLVCATDEDRHVIGARFVRYFGGKATDKPHVFGTAAGGTVRFVLLGDPELEGLPVIFKERTFPEDN